MPTPYGTISTSEGPVNPDAIDNQTIEEAQENSATQEADAEEQAVEQSRSETEG